MSLSKSHCQSLVSFFLFLLAGSSLAAGFRIPEISIYGTATSNAIVADTEALGTLPYNPAAMQFHDSQNISFGLMNFDPNNTVTPTGGSLTTSAAKDNFLIPSLYYMNRVAANWSWGLALNVPFGLETKWQDETFSGFAGVIDGLEPEQSKIEMANINPNIAFEIGEQTSASVGLMFYQVRELVFNTQAIKINGDGDGVGFNVGFMHQNGPWSVGATYKSRVKASLEGTVTAGGITAPATSEVTHPDMMQIGVRYQFTKKLAAEVDYERTGWNSFDKIEIYHSHPSPSISNPIVSNTQWTSGDTLRTSLTYQATEKFRLLFGYAQEKTVYPDEYFGPRIPDADRATYSIGGLYDFDYWQVEFAYMRVELDDRSFTASKTFGVDTSETNGSHLYNGQYTGEADVFGLGFNISF